MARKVVLISDLSGQDIPDDDQVELRVLSYPDLSEPVKLDASKIETDRLKLNAKPMALLELVTSDGTEQVAIDAEIFAQAVKGDVHQVLANAEGLSFAAPAAPVAPRRGRRARGEGAPAAARGEKVNYTDDDKFGQLHRGRLTDEEIALVKDNPEQASRNRQAQGHEPINWDDDKEQSRYRLTADDVASIKAKVAA